MKIDSDERPRLLAQYLTEHDSTVRATAAVFGVSKSTVHKDLTSRLMRIDPVLCAAAEKSAREEQIRKTPARGQRHEAEIRDRKTSKNAKVNCAEYT